MYAIAKRFPKDALEYACTFVYVPKEPGPATGWVDPTDAEGFCPLGRAFEYWCPQELDNMSRMPRPIIIAARIARLTATGFAHRQIIHEAHDFTDDWDLGYITNLRDAFGLEG